MFLLVVYDGLLALLIVVQLLPDFLSQEYISVPLPVALHIRVVVARTGNVTSVRCVVIDGGPEKYNNQLLPESFSNQLFPGN